MSAILIFSNINIVNAEDYTYDNVGRLIGVKYEDGRIINYEYDKGGNVTKVFNNQENGLISLEFVNFKKIIDLNEKINISVKGNFSDGKTEILTDKVTLKSSNDLVLQINQGSEIVGLKVGKVTLSAEYMGRKITLVIHVGTEIKDSSIGVEIKKDSKLNLAAVTSISGENIEYEVSDESIGTIDADGNLIILKSGTLKITVISKGAAKSITINIID